MTRRKFVFLFLLLGLFVLLLAPWANAPSSMPLPSDAPNEGASLPTVVPVTDEKPVQIKVAVSLNEAEFEQLKEDNAKWVYRHPDVTVELSRVEPAKAYRNFQMSSRLGDAADVMLMDNDWVKQFASSGYLMSADAAYIGEALAQQFDVLTGALKWNALLWGVPRDFDPYVFVWNRELLRTAVPNPEEAPFEHIEQWQALADKSNQSEGAFSWLAIGDRQPMAMLTWLSGATGQRTDSLETTVSDPWTNNTWGTALSLLVQRKSGIVFSNDDSQLMRLLVEGKVAVAVMPYSEVNRWLGMRSATESAKITIDKSVWNLPYIWPGGRSFVISSNSEQVEAAADWIAEMTSADVQKQDALASGKLPVYRSLYHSESEFTSLFSFSTVKSFPNQASEFTGPDVPVWTDKLTKLWHDFASGSMSEQDWIHRWAALFSDFQPDH